jgi:hypothetical protein
MSEAFAVEFETPEGERIDIGWDEAALAGLDAADGVGATAPWLLDGELDWDEVELIRVLSARFDDGRLLGVAAIRPQGAEGHGDELVVSALVGPDGGVEPVSETLFSVEYDGDGNPRRAGLELYRGEGSIPLRAAGEATTAESTAEGSLARTSAALRMRLAGTQGFGRLDIVRPA